MSKDNSFKKIVAEIDESTEKGSAMWLDEMVKTDIEVIPTGIQSIDDITGIGGVPKGKITEIFGDSGTGKTTLCLHLMKSATLRGEGVGFVDSEHALNFQRIEKIGVDKSKVIISQPNYGEQALEIIEMLIRSQKLSLVICDSVAALTPKAEIDKDMGDATMGSQARLMSQAMRKLVAVIGKNKVAMVFTNQTRAKLGSFFPETTVTGGNALRFYASMRIKIVRSGSVQAKDGTRLAGKYKITIVKNRLSIPYRDTEYYINESGIYTK